MRDQKLPPPSRKLFLSPDITRWKKPDEIGIATFGQGNKYLGQQRNNLNIDVQRKQNNTHIAKMQMGEHSKLSPDEIKYPRRNYPVERMYKEKILWTTKNQRGKLQILPPISP